MLYSKINFKSLKIVLGNPGNDTWIAYSRDSKYPVFNRVVKGSIEEIMSTLVYLFEARLQCAENCEGYSWNEYDSVQEWTEYVLNRYLLGTLGLGYENTQIVVPNVPYLDYMDGPIKVTYWEEKSPRIRRNALAGRL